MCRRFFLLAIVLFSGCTSEAEIAERAEARKAYDAAKERFAHYEAAHGDFIDTPNARMHYLRWGSSGLPLVWLHGTYSTAYEIAPFAEILVKDGYQVISIDWYGHGRTPIPEKEVSCYEACDDIAALMDKLDIEQAVIGGWSRGGSLSTYYYDAFPERTLGLVLLDGGSASLQAFVEALGETGVRKWVAPYFDGSGKPAWPTYETEFDLFHAIWKERNPETDWADLAVLARASKEVNGRWTEYRPAVVRWFEQNTLENCVRGMVRPTSTTRFLWHCTVLMPQVVFRHLHVPVLIVDPTGDSMEFAEQNRQLQQRHPELIELVTYAETSHNVLRERPKRFLDDLRRFLGRIKNRQ